MMTARDNGRGGAQGALRVLGVDPGLRVSGYAVIESAGGEVRVLDAGTIAAAVTGSLADRLAEIAAEAEALLAEYEPALMAVEELYAHYKHPRTAILMGHARGVFLAAAARRGVAVRGYAATRVKKSLTGNGRASKAQMQRAIQQRLGLKRLPEPADVADALAIAMCCVNEMQNSKCKIQNHN